MTVYIWGGDPMLKVVLGETRCQLESLDPNHPETVACLNWLKEANACLERKYFGGFLPYHLYDQVWALLNRIRHLLCRNLAAERLLPVLTQIRDGLGYISSKEEGKDYLAILSDIEKNLTGIIALTPPVAAPSMSLDEIRFHLERISRSVASARETHWRKVNMLRTRLITTAFILVALLLLSIVLIPTLSRCDCVHPQNLLIIAAFGALGGLVSALRTMESLQAPASAYYVQRTLLCLRPVVGAAAGVIVYLIQISGILVILAGSDCPTAAQLVLAFIAGFSERFFVAQIENIAQSKFSSADKNAKTDEDH